MINAEENQELKRLNSHEISEINDMIDAAMAEEREQCCKDVCHYCRVGWARVMIGADYAHIIPNGNGETGCDAYEIHQRAARKEGTL